MDRKEFAKFLTDNNIDPTIVSFNDPLHEGYGIRRNGLRWEIFIRERGVEYNVRGFPSESDALQAMCCDLIRYKSQNGSKN